MIPKVRASARLGGPLKSLNPSPDTARHPLTLVPNNTRAPHLRRPRRRLLCVSNVLESFWDCVWSCPGYWNGPNLDRVRAFLEHVWNALWAVLVIGTIKNMVCCDRCGNILGPRLELSWLLEWSKSGSISSVFGACLERVLSCPDYWNVSKCAPKSVISACSGRSGTPILDQK